MKFAKDSIIKRLGIFFFYDRDGIVDEYVLKMLKAYEKHFTEILTVCNGILTKEGRELLERISNNTVLVRENKGFDVWAYKTGLMYYGWEKVRDFDELIMFNFTVMGPAESFDPMFEEMNTRDVDFWGITIHNGAPFDPWGILEEKRIPIHLQSHFIAVRKRMLQSIEFQRYWDNMPMIKRYEEAVGKHEARFTKYFAECGFVWDYYVDTKDLISETFYPMFNMPVELIRNRKCPIFKRKIFIYEYENTIQENANQEAKALYTYLKNETSYNIDLIDKHLLRTAHQIDFVTATNLNFVLGEKENEVCKKLACIIDLKDIKILKEYFHCSDALKAFKDVYIMVGRDEDLKDIKEIPGTTLLYVASKKEKSKLVLDFLIQMYKKYDYIAVINSSEKSPMPLKTVLRGRQYAIYGSMLYSQKYINNIVEVLEDNKSLGLLVPPQSLHSEYFVEIGQAKDNLAEKIEISLKEIKSRVPFARNKMPHIPWDNCYWVKTETIEKSLDRLNEIRNIKYLEGENQILFPFLFQEQGYYTTFCTSLALAENLLGSSYQIFGLINKRIQNQHEDLSDTINHIYSEEMLDFYVKNRSKELSEKLDDIEQSTCWRMTKPIRVVIDFLKKF